MRSGVEEQPVGNVVGESGEVVDLASGAHPLEQDVVDPLPGGWPRAAER